MNKREFDKLALEEIKILQAIVIKHDDIRSTIINWNVGLITALCVAFLSGKSGLDRIDFFLIGVAIILLFFWLDVVYKIAQNRAIRRSAEIEDQIRCGTTYDGPIIGKSLTQPNTASEQMNAARNVRVWFPFLALLVLVALVTFSHSQAT